MDVWRYERCPSYASDQYPLAQGDDGKFHRSEMSWWMPCKSSIDQGWRLIYPRAGIVTVIIVALPVSAQAADPAQEAATAATHAGLAAQGASIEQVHMHLHHTVNCLVGPKGPGFDATERNPCQKLGDGAIPDAPR